MQKKIEKNGKTATVKAQIDRAVERRPGGLRVHRVLVTGVNNDYTNTEEYDTQEYTIEQAIEKSEKSFYFFADPPKDPEEEKLESLGFTKNP